VSLAAVLSLVLVAPKALADRRDQRAADLYTEGVALIRKGKYREGAAKVNAALARGATEPVEAQGSETRFLARPYDPYYWLGVAQMETGLPEQALANFEKSSTIVPKGRTQPVLADAPAEWADLQRRKSVLLATLDVPTPVVVAAATIPSPTATPFALQLPERTALPPPTAVPAFVALPRPAPATGPTGVPLPPGVLALREDLAALLADPSVSLRAGDALRPRMARLDAALGRGAAAAAAAELSLRRELSAPAGSAVLAAVLEAALEAHRERRYEESARISRIAGRLAPAAPQPDLLRASSLETLLILLGETRPGLAAEAREAYGAWRARRPPGAPPPRFLSPALRERLERPAPVPSRGGTEGRYSAP
jgi:tetratricopeptide (TPR) repeat protein